jgi:hypothetical protein
VEKPKRNKVLDMHFYVKCSITLSSSLHCQVLSYIPASPLPQNTTPKPSRILKIEAETRSDSNPKGGFTGHPYANSINFFSVMYYAQLLLSSRLASIVTSLSGVYWVSQI